LICSPDTSSIYTRQPVNHCYDFSPNNQSITINHNYDTLNVASMSEPRHNEYWRTGDVDDGLSKRTSIKDKVDMLAARHYEASEGWSNDKLRNHLRRCAQGLLSYYAYTNA